MKKILLLTLLLASSIGCIELFDDTAMVVLGDAQSRVCDMDNLEDLTGADRDHCWKDAALRKKDESLCMNVERNAPETKCYMEVALAKKNPTICYQINTRDSDAYTQAECLQKVAQETGDVGACDMIGDQVAHTFMSTYSKESCYAALGEDFVHNPVQIYNDNPEDFKSCQDLAYAMVHGKAPSGGDYLKQNLYDEMEGKGYDEVGVGQVPVEEKGYGVAEKLKDGDIVMLEFNGFPGETAAHYAVVKDGELWQVLRYKSGGKLDGPHDIEYFFQPREVYSEVLGKTVTGKPYQYYKILRRK